MIKLICDWCEAELKLTLSGGSHESYVVRYLPGNGYFSGSNWYVDNIAHHNNKLGDDLCPGCHAVAVEERTKAHEAAAKIMTAALQAAEEARKKLEEEARVEAKAQRVPRLERDIEMRKKERQRLANG